MAEDDDRRTRFLQRFQRVLDHIDGHTAEAFDLGTLSALAAYSPHHFHRQFGALVGLPLGRYVTFSRTKRAFRQVAGVAPTAFRAQPDWNDWHARFRAWTQTRTRTMLAPPKTADVEIVDFPATRIALLVHRGDHAGLNDSLQRFIAWRRATNLPRDRHATFNLLYADPESTPPAEFRMGIAVATHGEIAPNAAGIEASLIPAGPCARVRHLGSTDFLEPVFRRLYGEWLPASGREPRDFPPFLQRVRFYPDVPDAAAETDVFLPLKA